MKFKKYWIAPFMALMLMGSYLGAAQITRWQVNRASNSPAGSNETLVTIPKVLVGDILGSVIVNKCGTQQSNFTLYDSSAQAANVLGVIDTSSSTLTGGCGRQIEYFIPVSSAITYTKTGGADITILWNSNKEKP